VRRRGRPGSVQRSDQGRLGRRGEGKKGRREEGEKGRDDQLVRSSVCLPLSRSPAPLVGRWSLVVLHPSSNEGYIFRSVVSSGSGRLVSRRGGGGMFGWSGVAWQSPVTLHAR